MKMWFLPALAALAAAPAHADMTAIYAAPGGTKSGTTKVEVADDGRFRAETADGQVAFIHRDGRTYLAFGARQAHPMVVDLAVLRASMRETAEKYAPKMCDTLSAIGGKTRLVRQGTAVVAGRTGDAWFKTKADGTLPSRPELVISHDPALAPLAAVLAEEYRAGMSMMPDCPGVAALMDQARAAVESGAPLTFNGMDLVSVETGPVDPKRFELPAPPKTLEELRQHPKEDAPVVTIEPRAQ